MSKSKQVFACLEFPPDLVTFTEEILNGKLHFLCSVSCRSTKRSPWKVSENSQGKKPVGVFYKAYIDFIKKHTGKCIFLWMLQNTSDSTFQKIFTILLLLRSSHMRCSIKKGVLKNLAKFTGAGVSFLTKSHAGGLQQY